MHCKLAVFLSRRGDSGYGILIASHEQQADILPVDIRLLVCSSLCSALPAYHLLIGGFRRFLKTASTV